VLLRERDDLKMNHRTPTCYFSMIFSKTGTGLVRITL